MNWRNVTTVALAQALGVILYCFLVVQIVFASNGPIFTSLGEQIGPVFFLATLVFSVAIVGLIVFGYPAAIALKGKVREAVSVIIATFVLGFILVAIITGGLVAGGFATNTDTQVKTQEY